MTAQPYAPIPSGELSHQEANCLEIRCLVICGGGRVIRTRSSAVAFAFLQELGRDGNDLTEIIHDDREIDDASLAALNSYLRTGELDRGAFPFHVLPAAGNHRFAWNDFCRHLGLTFGEKVIRPEELDNEPEEANT